MVIKPNAKMLEICCGDGFNARHFYSSAASSIIALDFDKDAIPHVKHFNSAPNITYVRKTFETVCRPTREPQDVELLARDLTRLARPTAMQGGARMQRVQGDVAIFSIAPTALRSHLRFIGGASCAACTVCDRYRRMKL